MSDSDTGSDDYCSDEDRDDEYVAAVVQRRRLAHAAARRLQASGPRASNKCTYNI